MLVSGVLKFGATGRVICDGEGVPVDFCGGVPLDINGSVCISPSTPDLYLAGIGYRTSTRICAGTGVPSNFDGPFPRDAVGGLSLAETGPIVGYYAGIPFVADGRIAVELLNPPPVSAFSFAYDDLAFD